MTPLDGTSSGRSDTDGSSIIGQLAGVRAKQWVVGSCSAFVGEVEVASDSLGPDVDPIEVGLGDGLGDLDD